MYRKWSSWGKAAGIGLLSLSLMGAVTEAEGDGDSGAAGAIPESVTDALLACPQQTVKIPLNARISLDAMFEYDPYLYYEIGDRSIVRVTSQGIAVPLAKGTTSVETTVSGDNREPASCTFRLAVVDPTARAVGKSPKAESRNQKLNGKNVYVNTVVLPPGLPTDIGFGKDKIGFTEPMKAIVERHGASYAINGTYFSAYGGEPVPYGTLIKDGELVYGGTGGTLIGFGTDGRARMEEIRATIEGGTDGLYDSKHRWKASWVNRTGGATTIYTPHRGARIGTSEGVMIVVSGGKVTKVTEKENVKIPQDGFVIVKLRTNLKAEQERFPVGRKVHYRVLYANGKGRVADWSEVVTGVHAWPRLIQDGKLAVKDEKNAERAARSGIGITKDGGVVLATVGRATFGEIAQVLRAKGAVQGMSLDGGASAGIYSQGVMHFTPGRELSHTLMFGANLR